MQGAVDLAVSMTARAAQQPITSHQPRGRSVSAAATRPVCSPRRREPAHRATHAVDEHAMSRSSRLVTSCG